MGIFIRVSHLEELGVGYWENELSEHVVIDNPTKSRNNVKATTTAEAGSTIHTEGNMYRLKFSENWYIVGESDGKGGGNGNKGGDADATPVQELKFVSYRGRTLHENYDGVFVYVQTPQFTRSDKPAVHQMAQRAGMTFDEFTQIDNTCPVTERVLNDPDVGTGTSTTDWVDLVVGKG